MPKQLPVPGNGFIRWTLASALAVGALMAANKDEIIDSKDKLLNTLGEVERVMNESIKPDNLRRAFGCR